MHFSPFWFCGPKEQSIPLSGVHSRNFCKPIKDSVYLVPPIGFSDRRISPSKEPTVQQGQDLRPQRDQVFVEAGGPTDAMPSSR